MLDSIWDWFQHLQISEAKAKAENAAELAVTSGTAIAHVQGQLDTLVLANQAMWELLSEKLGVTEQELLKRMSEIDLRDGKLDGKIRKETITKCVECGHQLRKHRPNCYWCGARLSVGSPFAS